MASAGPSWARGAGTETGLDETLALNAAASYSSSSIPSPHPPSVSLPPPNPSQPAFLFEQVAFENFKHTLSFRGSKPQQFRLRC